MERRENPSVPAGLLDVPSLLLGPNLDQGEGPGYQESHTINKSFSHTITLDESGTGSSGTYTFDVVGSAHATDTASGWGGLVNSASGRLTIYISCHIVIHGNYSAYGFTVDSESYIETGFVAEDYTMTYLPTSDGTVNSYDGTYTRTWSLSWSGSVTNGVLSLNSLSYTDSWAQHWHSHTSYSDGSYWDSVMDSDVNVSESGSGTQAAYNGSQSWHEQTHSYVPGDPPYNYYNT